MIPTHVIQRKTLVGILQFFTFLRMNSLLSVACTCWTASKVREKTLIFRIQLSFMSAFKNSVTLLTYHYLKSGKRFKTSSSLLRGHAFAGGDVPFCHPCQSRNLYIGPRFRGGDGVEWFLREVIPGSAKEGTTFTKIGSKGK